MNKQNFITLTLIISGLALNPVMADAELNRISHSQNINHSIASNISSILYNRGLDENVADELSSSLVLDTNTLKQRSYIAKINKQLFV